MIRHSKLVHSREVNDVVVVSSTFLQQQQQREQLRDQDLGKIASTENGTRSTIASPSESPLEIKIDPDHDAGSASPKLMVKRLERVVESPAAAVPAADVVQEGTLKRCNKCNINFTYMSTFLAHKKYYCSSHAVTDNDVTAEVT